uniref:WRKY transcription factor n=1 Tax=Fagopyrum tataricum TaxID=62330 RepID=A0A4P9Q2V9_FAGTA|nr:WRKY transcription factor [Fagopyrum tataricum]
MSNRIPKVPVNAPDNPVPVVTGSNADSCWSSLAAEPLSNYYPSYFGDFSLSINQDSCVLDRNSDVLANQIGINDDRERSHFSRSAVAYASGTTTTSSNQSVSSYSSEDLPKKSNDSGGGGFNATTATSTKVKKKVQKRVRLPRFAFMTKSEVDHLEDGYRWRKYGQKAVKNSPFPRSYYRCTHTECKVKKRVERFWEDPTVVITTYEGQHCHHTIGLTRGGFMSYENVLSTQFALPPPRFYYPGAKVQTGQDGSVDTIQSIDHLQDEVTRENSGVLAICNQSSGKIRMDQGLLEDIVSPRPRDS